ncbi:MAG: protein kinase, partial [Clostridiales bacterium]|nr:protein kinase [Clostridiales bacterium]
MDLRKLEPLWGTCHLQDILGVGSYGVVYRAVQTTDGTSRACAVKHISIPKDAYEHHAYMDQLGTRDDEALKQFYAREIQSFVDEFQVQRLFSGKAHFVQVEDILIVPKDDMPGNDLFIRMELLHSIFHRFSEGMSGADKERETLRVGMDICSALVEMHARHYLHRDIKPQNILVSDDGEYKLGDFGSAHRLSGGASFLSVKGTLDYIAPDVFVGKMSDYSSDLYSLGLVLYQLLNHHRLPFTSSSSLPGAGDGNIRRLSGEPLPPPLEASPEVAAVILKACAFKPEDRFRDAGEMLQALKDIECLVSDRNIGTLMKQAWSCIQDGMADDAKALLAEVLTMYPQYAPAHAAKACIALGFRNESALSGAPFRYEDQPDWILAMHYADPDQRKIYDSYVSRTDEKVAAQIHRYAHDCAVEMAVKPNLSRENLDADLNAYKKTCIWSAQNRADGSPRKNSQVNEGAFREAVMKKRTGRVSPQSLKTAASMFDSIGEKDYSQQCLALANLSIRRKTRQILLSILVVLLAAGTLILYLNKAGSGKGRTSTQGRHSASITVIPRQKLFVSSVSMAPLESPITSPIPEPEQNTTPQPELNASPGPEQNATPQSELKSALEPDQNTTPEPELQSALEPDQNTTPEPKLKS